MYFPAVKLLSQLIIERDQDYFLEKGKDLYTEIAKVTNKYRAMIDVSFLLGFMFFVLFLFSIIF